MFCYWKVRNRLAGQLRLHLHPFQARSSNPTLWTSRQACISPRYMTFLKSCTGDIFNEFRHSFPFPLKPAGVNVYTLTKVCAGVAQLVRALDCGSRGPGFNPQPRYHPLI